jgi:hypothetical protein
LSFVETSRLQRDELVDLVDPADATRGRDAVGGAKLAFFILAVMCRTVQSRCGRPRTQEPDLVAPDVRSRSFRKTDLLWPWWAVRENP